MPCYSCTASFKLLSTAMSEIRDSSYLKHHPEEYLKYQEQCVLCQLCAVPFYLFGFKGAYAFHRFGPQGSAKVLDHITFFSQAVKRNYSMNILLYARDSEEIKWDG